MTRPNQTDPIMGMEEEIIMRLKNEGLISKSRTSFRQPLALGAVLAAAVAGMFTLQNSQPAAAPGQLFVLALYSDDSYRAPPSGDRSRAKEYGEWARAHSEGAAAVVGGEELEPSVMTLGTAPAPTNELVGFFTVRARSEADAVALAKTTPHLRYGGAVSVRPAAI